MQSDLVGDKKYKPLFNRIRDDIHSGTVWFLLFGLTGLFCVIHGIIYEDVVVLWTPCIVFLEGHGMFVLVAVFLYEVFFGTPINILTVAIHSIVMMEYTRNKKITSEVYVTSSA